MTRLVFRWSDADEDVILPVNRDRPRRLPSRVATLLARRTHQRQTWLGRVAAGVALLALGLGAGWEARGWQAGPAPQQRTARGSPRAEPET